MFTFARSEQPFIDSPLISNRKLINFTYYSKIFSNSTNFILLLLLFLLFSSLLPYTPVLNLFVEKNLSLW